MPNTPPPQLLDVDRADAGLDRPFSEVAVGDDLVAPGVVLEVGMVIDPGGDVGLDGCGQEALGTGTAVRNFRLYSVGFHRTAQ